MGFGSPSAPIWFIGIEEAATWSENPAQDEDFAAYSKRHAEVASGSIAAKRAEYLREGKRYTQIYDHMAQIRGRIGGSVLTPQEYADKFLFQHGHEVFQANLYPLGRPNTSSWPAHYKEAFGIGRTAEDQHHYRELVRSQRFDALRSFMQQHNAFIQITVCFGKTYWAEFRTLLELDNRPAEPSGICCYPEQKVILAPFFFFFYMMREVGEHRKTRIDVLVERAREWGISLRASGSDRNYSLRE